jgi:hypothetical protein
MDDFQRGLAILAAIPLGLFIFVTTGSFEAAALSAAVFVLFRHWFF